jgi:hypothetical protein
MRNRIKRAAMPIIAAAFIIAAAAVSLYPKNAAGGGLSCSLTIRCETVLDNLDNLDERKREIIPEDGIILVSERAAFTEGESAFDVLKRETRRAGVHLEFSETPVYRSAYIEGIGNLYELDAGGLSGWMYAVNGEFPGVSCSKYALKNGDAAEFVFTCDMGRDVGGEEAYGGYGEE